MSELELKALLETITIGQTPIPVAYDHFEQFPTTPKVVPPFILYRNTNTTTFKADDKVFFQENSYIVDLITEIKDVVVEQQLETLFNDNHLPYDKEEDYISDERIYQIRYFI